jgi:hypothetical protein
MTSADSNKGARQNRLRKVLSGMSKHFQAVPSMTIAQVVYPVSDLEARIQKDIAACDAADQARAAWLASVQAQATSHEDVDPLLRAIKQYVLLTWGDSKDASATLDDFGYAPRKPAAATPATKVSAAAKAKATRTARHTMGPKQKAPIKGTGSASPNPGDVTKLPTTTPSPSPVTPATTK